MGSSRLLAFVFAAVVLSAGVSASGADGVSATGVVRDAKGAAVAHVPVIWKLTPKGDDGKTFRQWQTVVTDAEGRYEIPGLLPGTFEIGVGGELNNYLEPDLNLKETVGDAAVRRDFVLDGALVFAGKVDLPGDAPVTVMLNRRGEGAGGCYVGGPAARRAALGAGRAFAFTALCPGIYELWAGGDGLAGVHRLVELTGDVRDCVVSLRPAGVVAGRVVRPEALGREYVDVRLSQGDDDSRMPKDGVSADGSFTFENVPPGRWRLTAHVSRRMSFDGDHRNLNGEALVVVPDPPARVDVPPVALERDDDFGLRVVLPPGAPPAEGRVTFLGEHRGPCDWQRFTATRGEDGVTTMAPVLGFASSRPYERDDGSLRLFDARKGALRVRVEAVGYETEERTLDVSEGATAEVPLRRAAGSLVRPPDPHMLRIEYFVVEVRRAGSSEPWRRIMSGDDRSRISDQPPPAGRVAHLAPGVYDTRMTTDRYALAKHDAVTIEDRVGPPIELDFDFDRGRTVSGTLRTRAGGRAAERLLRVFRVEDGKPVAMPERMPFAGEDGWRIDGLAPGRYRIALADSGAGQLAEIDVGEEDVEVDLVMCR